MYLYVKASHIISIIAWMAGMLYLPRLYVYHAGMKPGSEASEMLKIMERRLLRYIINPAMIATWIFGIWLITILGHEYFKTAGWLHVKLALVLCMQGVHALFSRWRRDFEHDRNTRSAKFYRIMNEAPTVILVIIVLLAVVKPF